MPLKLVSKKKKQKTEPTRRMLFTYEGKRGEGMKESGFGGFVSLWWIERENRGSQKEKCKNRIAPLPWRLSSLPIYPITRPLALLLPSPALPSSPDIPRSSLFHSVVGHEEFHRHGITEYHRIEHYLNWTVCFKGKEKHFWLGRTSPGRSPMCGTARASLSKHFCSPPKQCNAVRKKKTKNRKTHSSPQNTELSSFWTTSVRRAKCCLTNLA